MPRKPKATKITPHLAQGLRDERTNTDPVIDGDVRALTNFLRRAGVECQSHSLPALAKLIVPFMAHRKRH